MTQRLSTKIGVQGGLETNVETGGSQGFQVADNVLFKPIGGLSKTVGSKKLSEGLEGFERRLTATGGEDEDSSLSVVENSSGGEGKVLNYDRRGVRVDLFSSQNSPRIVLNPDQSFSGNTKLRIEFPQNIFKEDFPFVQSGFTRLSVFDGFFETQTDFVNVAVRQHSTIPNRLRFTSGFTQLPLKNAEIILTGSSGFSTPPALGEYNVYFVGNFSENEIVLPPASTSGLFTLGQSGVISFSLKTTKIITLSENAQFAPPNALIGTNTRVFFETEGKVYPNFSLSQVQLPKPLYLGKKVVFPSNEGQNFFSKEDPEETVVSRYGVPRGIDAIGFSEPDVTPVRGGCLETGRIFAYCTVFKKVIGNRIFLGSPSPHFYHRTVNPFTLQKQDTGITLSQEGWRLSTSPLLPSVLGDKIFIEFEAPLATPAITTLTTVLLEKDGLAYLLTTEEQIRSFGELITVLPEFDFRVCREVFVSAAVPHELYEDFNAEKGKYDYFVQLYRTPTILQAESPPRSPPDLSQFFLVKEKKFVLEELFLPHILVVDDEIPNRDLRSQLALYTNPLQEGALARNDLCPQYQTALEKQGVFYAASLQRKEQKNFELQRERNAAATEPVLEQGVTEVVDRTDNVSSDFAFQRNVSEVLVTAAEPTSGTLLLATDFLAFLLAENVVDSYFLALDIKFKRVLLLKTGGVVFPGNRAVLSVLEDTIPLNPLLENTTLRCFLTPLWRKVSDDFLMGNYENSQNNLFSKLNVDTFYQNEIYSFIYRPLNLSPRVTPDWLLQDSPTATFLNNSNFTLYFNDNSLNQDPTGRIISASYLLKRRDFEPYEELFPAWSYTQASETGFKLEPAKNQIAYSKPFEPQAFPPFNFLTVGSSENEIFAIFSVRDSIIIASSEGFYRLTGAVEDDFALTQIESEMKPLSRLLMAEQNDEVFALTQKGLVSCQESEARLIDAAVANLIEQFLGFYRRDLPTLTTRTCYTATDTVLNLVSFFLPSFTEKDLSRSRWGLNLDTQTKLFSTIDLFRAEEKKKKVLSLAFEPDRQDQVYFQTPSLEPFSLAQKNKSITREDFLEESLISTLNNSWQARATVAQGETAVTITCFQPHLLETGDFVKILQSIGSLASQKTYSVEVIDSLIFQVTLKQPSFLNVDSLINFRFGRVDYRVGFRLEPEDDRLRLSLSSFYQVEDPFDPFSPIGPFNDFSPEVNDLLWIQKPWPSELQNALQTNADLEGARAIVETTTGSDPSGYFAFIELSQPSTNLAFISGWLTFSYDTPARYRQQFSIVRPLSEPDFGVLFPFNDQLTFPFEFIKLPGDRVQGFLEKPIDSQMRLDRPVYIGTTAPITIMTSRITGGDPCSLKNFEQLVATFQNFFSCTRVQVSFQGDRFSAAAGVVWKAQQSLEGSFDPAFGDEIWSAVFEQWASLTSPKAGWRQATPFVPLRITVPNEVSQSTYLTVFLRHERPFESMSLGTIAINGSVIDPSSIGV